MAEWGTFEVRALGVLIAFLALLATLAYRWLVGHQRDFQMLLERSDKEAEKRERAIQATMERIDKETEKREQATQATMDRIDKEAEKREQAIQATMERFDKEAEKREQAIQATMERFDKEAEKRERAIQATMDRIDKEAEKREQAIQTALERSDRAFETLTARSNELAKDLTGIAQRTARSEGALDALAGGEPQEGSKSTAVADEASSVAAQQVPGEPPAE